jgi:hypothetical protein
MFLIRLLLSHRVNTLPSPDMWIIESRAVIIPIPYFPLFLRNIVGSQNLEFRTPVNLVGNLLLLRST